ncbi:MAG: hypothetical protein ACI90V_004021 [Bacillariaceae sp.]|jgi:hypothetical protein
MENNDENENVDNHQIDLAGVEVDEDGNDDGNNNNIMIDIDLEDDEIEGENDNENENDSTLDGGVAINPEGDDASKAKKHSSECDLVRRL